MDPNTWPPELYTVIGSFMSQSDLAVCTQVCKAWCSIFQPLIWTDITLQQQPLSASRPPDRVYHVHLAKEKQRKMFPDMGPSDDQLALHGSLVRSLRFRNPIPERTLQAAVSCDRLYELDMAGWVDPKVIDLTLLLIADVITQSQATLKRIRVSHRITQSMGEESTMVHLLDSIATCGAQLQELTLAGWNFPWPGLESLMEACPRLEMLVLERLSVNAFRHPVPGSTPAVFENMHHLQMKLLQGAASIGNQLDFARQCPNLRKLLVDSQNSVDPIPSGAPWPKLEYLRMAIYSSQQSWNGMTEDDCIQVLDQFPCLPRYSFSETHFGQRAFSRLVDSGALATLQVIDLFQCRSPTSAIVQTLLSSCPNLKVLKANVLHATDIDQSKPWICHDLLLLDLYIDMNPSPEAEYFVEDRVVFGQLARLENLKYLFLTNDGFIPEGTNPTYQRAKPKWAPRSLSWTLKSGLGALDCLLKLEKLHVPIGGLEKATAKDLQWMLMDHWSKLELIQYRCFFPGGADMVKIQKLMGKMLKVQGKEKKVKFEVFEGWMNRHFGGTDRWYTS